MCKGLFITGTGTDVGKTYVTALLLRTLREAGYLAGYYKAALSGADSIAESDAGYVKRTAGLGQAEESLLSYRYQTPVSPHLAAQLEGNPVELECIQRDYAKVQAIYPYVTVEGSGGIVCPLRWEGDRRLLLEDVVQALHLQTVIVSDAGLGSINAAVLTAAYLRARQIGIKGIIVNRYTDSMLHRDNVKMIEALAQVPVLAVVPPQAKTLPLTGAQVAALYA